MCWLGTEKNIKTAEEDIRVFKIVFVSTNGLVVPYFNKNCGVVYGQKTLTGFEPVKETLQNKAPFIFENAFMDCGIIYGTVSEAFHSYSKDKLLESSKKFTPEHNNRRIVSSDIKHFFVCENSAGCVEKYDVSRTLIMHCIIPKGTRYAMNETGEIVSDALKIVSFEEIK